MCAHGSSILIFEMIYEIESICYNIITNIIFKLIVQDLVRYFDIDRFYKTETETV